MNRRFSKSEGGTLELWNVHRCPWTFGRGVTREFRTFAFGRDVCDSWKIRLAAGLGSFAFDSSIRRFSAGSSFRTMRSM